MPEAPPDGDAWTTEGTMLWVLVASWSAVRVLCAAFTREHCGGEATLAIATLVIALIALATRRRRSPHV
jgi:hypothetical protein